MSELEYQKGDRIEYIGAPVFDGIIWTGDVGVVVEVKGGWALASWRDGMHSVPIENVRPGAVPVLAHPRSNRIFAAAHGTAHALWLTAADFAEATLQGASSVMRWSGGSCTDLGQLAGDGWIWGREYPQEADWLRRSYHAAADLWQ